MSEFNQLLSRINLANVTSLLLYGADASEKNADSYEANINASFNIICEKLAKIFPCTPENDEILHDLLVEFATTHSDVYLQVGAIIGFQLYKVMEQGYTNTQSTNIDNFLKECATSNEKSKKEILCNSLLDDFLEKRINGTLGPILTTNSQYQDIKDKADAKTAELKKYSLNDDQMEAIDHALSANNAVGAVYGLLAYKQGFEDARNLLAELLK